MLGMSHELKETYRQAMIELFRANPRVDRVVLFGSRATGEARPASDVDLALFGEELTLDDQSRLAAAIDATTIPQRADLHLVRRITSKDLLDHIESQGIEWYRKEDNSTSGKG